MLLHDATDDRSQLRWGECLLSLVIVAGTDLVGVGSLGAGSTCQSAFHPRDRDWFAGIEYFLGFDVAFVALAVSLAVPVLAVFGVARKLNAELVSR